MLNFAVFVQLDTHTLLTRTFHTFSKPMENQTGHGAILMTPTRDGIIVMYLVVELRYDEYEFEYVKDT